MKEIIIKVSNDRILFTPRISIPIQHTNIPIKYLTFRTNQDIFWKVEMLDYKSENRCLKVSVIDYNATEIMIFDQQQPKKAIDELLFEMFDWVKLEPLLTYYQTSKLREVLFNIGSDPFSKGEKQIPFTANQIMVYKETHSLPESRKIEQIQVVSILEEFWIPFSDTHFMLGYITFKKFIERIGRELNFKILNHHILAEFDTIKYWFAKKLNTKKIKVTATITLIGNEIAEVEACSKQIDQITDALIDSVKFQRTMALKRVPRLTDPDKSLFTADEIFSQIDTDDKEGNIFRQSEEDILDFFSKASNIRNKNQLAYLSGKKQSKNSKLLFTLNPNFGFLFFVEGAKDNHFVWELLDSHATYIWSVDKRAMNIKEQYRRIEVIVNTIRSVGRLKYVRTYKNYDQDNVFLFRKISHENIGSNLVDDFPTWKSKLNEQLT